MDLRWQGGLEDAVALDRLLATGARDVTLVHARDEVVPAHVAQAQAVALGLPIRVVERETAGASGNEGASGWRAVIVASRDRDDLGRFVEEGAPPSGARTLVVDGPRFARRVEVVAGDVVPWRGGWRLALDLKGC